MGSENETLGRISSENPPRSAAPDPALSSEEADGYRITGGQDERVLLSDLSNSGEVWNAVADRTFDQLHLHGGAADG